MSAKNKMTVKNKMRLTDKGLYAYAYNLYKASKPDYKYFSNEEKNFADALYDFFNSTDADSLEKARTTIESNNHFMKALRLSEGLDRALTLGTGGKYVAKVDKENTPNIYPLSLLTGIPQDTLNELSLDYGTNPEVLGELGFVIDITPKALRDNLKGGDIGQPFYNIAVKGEEHTFDQNKIAIAYACGGEESKIGFINDAVNTQNNHVRVNTTYLYEKAGNIDVPYVAKHVQTGSSYMYHFVHPINDIGKTLSNVSAEERKFREFHVNNALQHSVFEFKNEKGEKVPFTLGMVVSADSATAYTNTGNEKIHFGIQYEDGHSVSYPTKEGEQEKQSLSFYGVKIKDNIKDKQQGRILLDLDATAVSLAAQLRQRGNDIPDNWLATNLVTSGSEPVEPFDLSNIKNINLPVAEKIQANVVANPKKTVKSYEDIRFSDIFGQENVGDVEYLERRKEAGVPLVIPKYLSKKMGADGSEGLGLLNMSHVNDMLAEGLARANYIHFENGYHETEKKWVEYKDEQNKEHQKIAVTVDVSEHMAEIYKNIFSKVVGDRKAAPYTGDFKHDVTLMLENKANKEEISPNPVFQLGEEAVMYLYRNHVTDKDTNLVNSDVVIEQTNIGKFDYDKPKNNDHNEQKKSEERKYFKGHGSLDGHYIPVVGDLESQANAPEKPLIIVGEGISTMYSVGALFNADDLFKNNLMIVSAGNSTNLPKTVKQLATKYPDADIIIAADNDGIKFEEERRKLLTSEESKNIPEEEIRARLQEIWASTIHSNAGLNAANKAIEQVQDLADNNAFKGTISVTSPSILSKTVTQSLSNGEEQQKTVLMKTDWNDFVIELAERWQFDNMGLENKQAFFEKLQGVFVSSIQTTHSFGDERYTPQDIQQNQILRNTLLTPEEIKISIEKGVEKRNKQETVYSKAIGRTYAKDKRAVIQEKATGKVPLSTYFFDDAMMFIGHNNEPLFVNEQQLRDFVNTTMRIYNITTQKNANPTPSVSAIHAVSSAMRDTVNSVARETNTMLQLPEVIVENNALLYGRSLTPEVNQYLTGAKKQDGERTIEVKKGLLSTMNDLQKGDVGNYNLGVILSNMVIQTQKAINRGKGVSTTLAFDAAIQALSRTKDMKPFIARLENVKNTYSALESPDDKGVPIRQSFKESVKEKFMRESALDKDTGLASIVSIPDTEKTKSPVTNIVTLLKENKAGVNERNSFKYEFGLCDEKSDVSHRILGLQSSPFNDDDLGTRFIQPPSKEMKEALEQQNTKKVTIEQGQNSVSKPR